MSNFKPALFAHFRFIELIYPTSAFCWQIDSELRVYFKATQDLFTEDKKNLLVVMNTFKNLGQLLKDLAEIDECFYYWNGKCAGERMGNIMLSLLGMDVAEDYTTVTGFTV